MTHATCLAEPYAARYVVPTASDLACDELCVSNENLAKAAQASHDTLGLMVIISAHLMNPLAMSAAVACTARRHMPHTLVFPLACSVEFLLLPSLLYPPARTVKRTHTQRPIKLRIIKRDEQAHATCRRLCPTSIGLWPASSWVSMPRGLATSAWLLTGSSKLCMYVRMPVICTIAAIVQLAACVRRALPLQFNAC